MFNILKNAMIKNSLVGLVKESLDEINDFEIEEELVLNENDSYELEFLNDNNYLLVVYKCYDDTKIYVVIDENDVRYYVLSKNNYCLYDDDLLI